MSTSSPTTSLVDAPHDDTATVAAPRITRIVTILLMAGVMAQAVLAGALLAGLGVGGLHRPIGHTMVVLGIVPLTAGLIARRRVSEPAGVLRLRILVAVASLSAMLLGMAAASGTRELLMLHIPLAIFIMGTSSGLHAASGSGGRSTPRDAPTVGRIGGARPRRTRARGATGQVQAGDSVAARELRAVSQELVELPAPARLLHLQFRRFAGCPVCNLHLRSFARRHGDLVAAGIREVVVFHSSAADLRPHTEGLPFPVVPDPDKRLYREFGVESSPRGVLDPRAWPAIVVGLTRSFILLLRGRTRAPRLRPEGGRFGLPADLLIAPDGTVLASHYGRHVDDHWAVDDVLRLAAERPAPRSEAPARQ